MSKELQDEIKGRCYLHREKSNKPSDEAMHFLSLLYSLGNLKILCASAANPKTYKEQTPVSSSFDYWWITRREKQDVITVDPENEPKFKYMIEEYLSENDPCVMLIDIARIMPTGPSGDEPKKRDLPPEWIKYNNQKNNILNLLRSIVDEISTTDSTCIFTVAKGMLDERFLSALQRETEAFYDTKNKKSIYISQNIEKRYKDTFDKKVDTKDMQNIITTINAEEYSEEIIPVLSKTTNPLIAFKLILESENPKDLINSIVNSDYPIVTFAEYVIHSTTRVKAFIALFVKKEDRKKLLSKMKKSTNPMEEVFDYLKNK